MNKDKLIELLSLGEGQSVEFKSSYRTQIVGQQVCAFLNTRGGYIVCGINDKGAVIGINNRGSVCELENQLVKGLNPKALVTVEMHQIKGKSVFVVEVPAGKDIPYSFNNAIYIREGEHTRKADVETIRDMVLRRQSNPNVGNVGFRLLI